jgi:hypothetical protein
MQMCLCVCVSVCERLYADVSVCLCARTHALATGRERARKEEKLCVRV